MFNSFVYIPRFVIVVPPLFMKCYFSPSIEFCIVCFSVTPLSSGLSCLTRSLLRLISLFLCKLIVFSGCFQDFLLSVFRRLKMIYLGLVLLCLLFCINFCWVFFCYLDLWCGIIYFGSFWTSFVCPLYFFFFFLLPGLYMLDGLVL